MAKIRVLVVDDSALIRNLITGILSSDSGIEVIGTAATPIIAREKIKDLNPDVITLDIQMPEMDGLTFLEKIMTLRPMPVVMVSTLTEKGAVETIKALELGAVDYVTKPSATSGSGVSEFSADLITKVKCAATATIKKIEKREFKKIQANTSFNPRSKVVAIGSSTGGIEALTKVIMQLPENCPAVLISQHMPAKFTASFASRLNSDATVNVYEAEDNMPVKPGNVYIAPGNFHMRICQTGVDLSIKISQDELVNGHRPSVDILFHSFANTIAKKTTAFILTGMGSDGALGIKEIREKGGKTYGQNQQTCLVYGMPKAAHACGGTEHEIDLMDVAKIIME